MNVKISVSQKSIIFNVTGTKKEDIIKIEEFLTNLFVGTGIVCEEPSGFYKMDVYCLEATYESVINLLHDFIEKN